MWAGVGSGMQKKGLGGAQEERSGLGLRRQLQEAPGCSAAFEVLRVSQDLSLS